MTTGISLVRENTMSMQPPRALWVSFPLGRPLGKPDDAGFQHRVIDAALNLLTKPSGPVLADYPEDAPLVALSDAPACPVSFSKPAKLSSFNCRSLVIRKVLRNKSKILSRFNSFFQIIYYDFNRV